MNKKVTRLVLLNSLLSLSLGLMAESQKPKNTIDVNADEEVTDRIFDEWYEGKIVDFCSFLDGHIKRIEQKDIVYLETFVRNNKEESLLPVEKNAISFFLSKKLEEAKNNPQKRALGWAILDSKTKCTYRWVNGVPVNVRCLSAYSKEEFEDKFLKRQKLKKS